MSKNKTDEKLLKRFNHIVAGLLNTCIVTITISFLPLNALADDAPVTLKSSTPATQSAHAKINPDNYGLDDILSMVPIYNPALLAAEKKLGIDLAQIKISKQRVNPQVMGYYGFGPMTSVLGNPQQGGISQLVETAGKHDKRIAISKATYDADLADFNVLVWETQNETWVAYVDVLVGESSIELLNKQADLLDKLVDIANKRFNAGAAAEAELLQAKLSRKQIDIQLMDAENTLKIARNKLNALVGNTMPEAYKLSSLNLMALNSTDALFPDLKHVLPPVDELVQGAYQNRLDLKASQLATKVGQKELKLAKSLIIPDVQVSGGGLFVRSPSPFSATAQDRNFGGGYVMATIEVPIFNQHKGEISAAEAHISQSKAEFTAKQAQIKTEIQQSFMEYESAKKSVLTYQDGVLPDASEVVNLAQKSYQYGKTGLANVIVAQQSERETMQGYLDSFSKLVRAWGALQRAYGKDKLP